jgi:NADPH:quinone reductase-like Zn-dependent oxidoreductase
MKAAVRTKYGGPSVLAVKEIERPVPMDDEVLIKVYATTVNRSDYHALTGKPFIMRFFTGLSRPKLRVTGSDFVGKVESVGRNVKLFKEGDKVMGFIDMGSQSHAEYLAIAEYKVTAAPPSLPYDQIPACLEGAFYALSGVQSIKPLAGQRGLVLGATGAIGTSYVQLLKHYQVEVTAVCEKIHSDLITSLGAIKIVDYKTDDFTRLNDRFDFVVDAVGKYSFSQCKHLLKDKGKFTSSQPNLFDLFTTWLGKGKKVLFAFPRNLITNLAFLNSLAESGSFKPVIDRKYTLEQIAEAYTYVGSGQKVGNVIITISSGD